MLVVLWVALTVVTLLTTPRERSYRQLAQAIGSGEVGEVAVVGDSGRGRGSGTVLLEWRQHLLLHTATVEGARPLSEAPRGTNLVVLESPVAETLVERFPGLDVRSTDEPSGGRGVLLGLLGLATATWTVLVLLATPHVVRATRWAWFWLFWILPPVGILAFLLAGGPTGLVPQRPGGRRLTGGWAFLLAVLLGGTSLVAALTT